MSGFKVGDKVKLIKGCLWTKKAGLVVGEIYTISIDHALYGPTVAVALEEGTRPYVYYSNQFELVRKFKKQKQLIW